MDLDKEHELTVTEVTSDGRDVFSSEAPDEVSATLSTTSFQGVQATYDEVDEPDAEELSGTPLQRSATMLVAPAVDVKTGRPVAASAPGEDHVCLVVCCIMCRNRLKGFASWFLSLVLHILFSLILLGIVTAVGVLTHMYYENTTIADASLTTWCIFLGSMIILWLLSHVASWLLFAVIRSAIPYIAGKTYRQAVLIRAFRFPVAYLIWAILIMISWRIVFGVINPFPAQDDNGNDRSLNDGAEWLFRLMGVNIVFAVLLIIRRYILVSASLERRTMAFYDQVQDTLRAGLVIDTLTKHLDPEMFSASWDGELIRRFGPRMAHPVRLESLVRGLWAPKEHKTDRRRKSVAPAYKKKSAKRDGPASGSEALDSEDTELEHVDQAFLNADFVQYHYITACNGATNISSRTFASRLASVLFTAYKHPTEDTVDVQRFWAACEGNEELYFSCIDVFDPNGAGALTKEWLRDRCTQLYQQRRNVARSLKDLDSIITALASFLMGAVFFVLLFALIIVFSQGPFAELVVSLTTTFFALSFVFAETARNFFNSYVFLFIRKPFDVGDRVYFEPNYKTTYVVRMELLTTTFKAWDGHIITVPNYVLHTREIINVRRSKDMSDSFELQIGHDTPMAKINQMRDAFFKFCEERPNDYIAKNCAFHFRELQKSNALTMLIVTGHLGNFQNGEHMARRTEIILFLKEKCEELGITWLPPTQNVSLEGGNLQARRGDDPGPAYV